jgi:hypothetical protein
MTEESFFSSTKAAATTVEIDFGDRSAPKKYALGYWSIRGLGAPITMMMCAAKVPFTLFLYDVVEDGESGWTSDYFAAKGDYIKKFKQPLWNLPFCVDRENKRVISQSNACLAFLGRAACGMFGDDEIASSECEQLLCEIFDLRNNMVRYAYGSGGDVSSVVAKGRAHLKKLEAWLEIQAANEINGKKRKVQVAHLVNGKFSAPDFHLYEMLDQYEALAKENGQDLYDGLNRIKEFKALFSALPENQFYLNSWLHKELSFNNCSARFGSLPGPKTYVHGDSAKEATWRRKGVVELSP